MNALERLARWYLMRRATPEAIRTPGYREQLPGWDTVAAAGGRPGARWRELWCVMAFDEHGNSSPVSLFYEGQGWTPLYFEDLPAAERWLDEPVAGILKDGTLPVTVFRHYIAGEDVLIRGTPEAALAAGAAVDVERSQDLPGDPGEEY